MGKGKVYIIGVGPGDYRLMTLMAAECISSSDAIVYDRLIDSKVLNFASDNAELIYVGKQPELHLVPQDEINRILLGLALEGKTVARVKGGDPFLFGRGGEECEFLQGHGIEFEVVPGVTSAIAVPAYAGIPVTHREYASSLHIITGHKSTENKDTGLDFETFARLEGTLVFLMGVKNIKEICSGLIRYGKPADTPAAIVENGASLRQRVLRGTLGDIIDRSVEAGVKSPAIIIVGSVAKLGDKLAWFGKGPLSGKRIVVTRPASQSARLVKSLEMLGAQVIEFPTIKMLEIEDYQPLQKVLDNISEYKWLVFTSSNGVNFFIKQMKSLGKDIRLLAGVKLAAVGPAAEESLKEKGLNVDFVPEVFTTRHLLDGLIKLVGHDEKVLLARSEIAGSELPEGLKRNGICVDEITIYNVIQNDIDKSELVKLLKENNVDFVTFTSPSTLRGFVSIIGREIIEEARNTRLVCVGPVTAKAALEMDLIVSGCADEHTDDGIIKKLIEL